MAIELVKLTKNTRGVNSREISYMAIGKFISKMVERESKPVFNADGSPKLDSKGNQEREPLGKDANGKLITIQEEVQEFVTEGVLTDMADALELVNNEEQVILDCFVEGYNERAYALEADKDELDEFIADLAMDKDQVAAFKKTARQISRNYELSLIEAAEQVKMLMVRAQEKAKAKAAAAEAASAQTVTA